MGRKWAFHSALEKLSVLQSNSGLWTDDVRLFVRPSVNILVNLGKSLRLSFGICFAIQPYRLQRFHVIENIELENDTFLHFGFITNSVLLLNS